MSCRVTYWGHSAFEVRTSEDLSIWIDPWLDNPKAPASPSGPPRADVVLITHGHGDHLGNALALAKSPGCEVVAIHEIQHYLLSKGAPSVMGMNIGGTYATRGLRLTMVPAVHSSSIDEGGQLLYGGEAAGFVVGLPDGATVYHAGDTALFGDMALIGELYRPDVAMLPIGSHYVMGPREAAYAARLLKAPKVIPMHYGTFPVLTGTVEAFKAELSALGVSVEVLAMAPGETQAL